ncbi:MAG: hypothetical protein AUG74_15545 [Bacteroidetes bacterium 13_1_20CM_4_60_6]|nr:MAG: hypothetical protein AUG74_15545 [Bacteroidetes bacterium 13_1_20CM_4_60_6]
MRATKDENESDEKQAGLYSLSAEVSRELFLPEMLVHLRKIKRHYGKGHPNVADEKAERR